VRAAVEPVDKARFCVLYPVTLAGEGAICCALLHDELHVLDTAIEVRVEISRQRGVCDFILLVGLVLDVDNVHRVPEDALGREELLNEAIPV
jgi:hypothetical protein